MPTQVYSWRVSSELKSRLEHAARQRKTSVASVLDTAAREWLENTTGHDSDNQRQRAILARVMKCAGTLDSETSKDSESIRSVVRERVRAKYGK